MSHGLLSAMPRDLMAQSQDALRALGAEAMEMLFRGMNYLLRVREWWEQASPRELWSPVHLQVYGTVAALVAFALVLRSARARALAAVRARPKPYYIPEPAWPTTQATVERGAGGNASGKPGAPIQCYNPATGEVLGTVPSNSKEGIDRAVAAAGEAQRAWALTGFEERRAVLRSMLQFVLEHAHDICRVAAADSGKTMADAALGEILVTAEKLRWTIAHGERALRPSRRPTNLLMAYKRNTVRYEPMGVVAALVSWNYPFHNLIGPVISALFAGNGIVVKVSEHTAWSAPYFLNIARGALLVHGHDPKLVQAVACWPQVAGHLTAHPGIRHVTFIGSQAVARLVAADAARSLTPLVAELGGKDPFVVLDSARPDLPRIADIIMRGTFQAAGQNCVGIERVIAPAPVYARLVAMLEPRVRALRLGPGPDADVGAMISDASFARLEDLVADAVARGARLLAGGARHPHPQHPHGHYFAPTMLADVTPAMRIAREECFAPILVLMRAPSPAAADILAVANASPFGLGASVHGAERDPALHDVVRGLKAGMVAVNDFAAYYAVQLPFGGVAGSGYGRFAGDEGLRGMCNLKSVCEDRLGWLGIRTAIPPPLRYPVKDQDRAWRFAQGVVELGYGEATTRVAGLARIMRNA